MGRGIKSIRMVTRKISKERKGAGDGDQSSMVKDLTNHTHVMSPGSFWVGEHFNVLGWQ